MEPITMIVLPIIIAGTGILAARLLFPLLVFTKDALYLLYRQMLEDHDLVILGGKQSGKSSLILLLTTGKPFYVGPRGKISSPEPTAGAVFVNKNAASLSFLKNISKRERIQKDVGGEFIDLWRSILKEVNPHGIIYMIDGRLPNEQLQHATDDIFFIIAPEYSAGHRNLRALHVFINFIDEIKPPRQREVFDMVTSWLKGRASNPNLQSLKNVKLLVSLTHLSPKLNAWPEATTALDAFGNNMRGLR